jgi:hypothetical protein
MLKQAILDHHVLVGMSIEMVIYAMGEPQQKIREREGQMPFEEWIYGESPNPVEFVRINGNRVIRVEEAEVGKPPVIRADNEMGDYWSTNAATDQAKNVHTVKLGDVDPADEAKQSAPQGPPPSLRLPGETLPTDNDKNHPVMGPVQYPPGMGPGSGSGSGSGSTSGTTTSGTTSGQQKEQPPVPPASQPSSSSPQQYVAVGSASQR